MYCFYMVPSNRNSVQSQVPGTQMCFQAFVRSPHMGVACQTLRSSCVKLSIFLYWTISYWNASFVVTWLFDSIWFSLDLHALDVCTLYLQFPSNCFWGTVLDQSHIFVIGSHFPLRQETKNGARECVRLCRPSPEFRKLPTRIGKISSVKGDSRDSQ